MKKLLFIILFITSILSLSCNRNKVLSPSYIGEVGEITVDPYKLAPLSAVYRTETLNGVPITVKVKGLYGEPDIIHTYPAGYGTEFEIHGMFPESMNTIEVNDGGRIITKNISSGSLVLRDGSIFPAKLDVEINKLPDEKYPNNPDLYFSIAAWNSIFGVSRNGYIRYFNNQGYNFLCRIKNENNKIVIYNSSGIFNLLGNNILYTILNANPHHDMIKKGNNNYLQISSATDTYGSRLVEFNNNITINDYRFEDIIRNIVNKSTQEDIDLMNKIVVEGTDWFHANSIVYDSSTDILYVSSRHRGVLAIDYSEWKLIWWMADETLSTQVPESIPYNYHFKDLKSLEPYRVKGDAFNDGPKNQHALFLFSNGNLGMFDNQGDELNNPNGSRYVEYKITGNYGNYTAQKIYEYREPSLYSKMMSDVDFTGDNKENILITYADVKKIIEVDRNTKEILFKITIPAITSIYRADKMPLYYDEGRVYSEDCNLKNPN